MTIKGEPYRNGSEAALFDNVLIRGTTKEEMIDSIIEKLPKILLKQERRKQRKILGKDISTHLSFGKG